MTVRPLVFLDTETSGLGPQRQAWEVALIRRDPDGSERATEFFLPIDCSKAEPGALNIGGYYKRHPYGVASTRIPAPQPMILGRPTPMAPYTPSTLNVLSPGKAAKLVAQWTDGATLVGANPAFDTQVFERLLRGNAFEPRWHYRLRDVEAMVVGLTGDEQMGGLARCAALFGITVDPALEHTAMGDARVAQRVYDAVMTAARQATSDLDLIATPVGA